MNKGTAVGHSVDQTLHGYRQGHRLVESSIQLDHESEALMLSLTDLLTVDPLKQGHSYLSGYPLRKANKFVLARTWPAHESMRPGSVWTHSLVIDYSLLTILEDLFPLLDLLTEPKSLNFDTYGAPIALRDKLSNGQGGARASLDLSDDKRLPEVFRQMYGTRAQSFVCIESTARVQDEALTVGLWRQMWPRLRRDTSFFTADVGGVKEVSTSCQIVVSKFRAGQQQLINDDVEEFGFSSDAISRLSKDISRRGPTKLRRFIGRYAFDASSPRKIVPALVDIYSSSKNTNYSVARFSRVLGEVPGLSRLKQDLIVQSLKGGDGYEMFAEALELYADEVLVGQLPGVEERIRPSLDLDRVASRVVPAVLNAKEGTIGMYLRSALVDSVSAPVLAAQKGSKQRKTLLQVRPDIVVAPEFWASETDSVSMVSAALQAGASARDILRGLDGRVQPPMVEILLNASPDIAMDIYHAALRSKEFATVVSELAVRAGFLELLASSDLPIAMETLEIAARECLGHSIKSWPDSATILNLLHRVGTPTYAHPHLAVLCLRVAVFELGPKPDTVFEIVFDAIYDAASRYSLPTICKDCVLSLPSHTTTFWLPDRLIGIALKHYSLSGAVRPRIVAITHNASVLIELFRAVRTVFGEPHVRHLYADLENESRLAKVPRANLLAAIKSSMPYFSKELGSKKK